MTSLDIRINILRISDYSASLKSTIEEETLLLMIKSFSRYILNLYGSLIEEAINSKRYEGNWEPVEEEGYLDYLGVTPTTPIIYLIKDALEVKKVGYNFVVGINPRYKYPGSSLSLLRVLRAIDNGTSDFSARPIFSNLVREINQHILDLWRGYLSMKGVI